MKLRYALLALVMVVAMIVPTIVGAETSALPGSGWWTGQQIQNVGTAAANIVSTAYDSASSTTYTASAGPVDPGAAVTFLPTNFGGMSNGFQGSAVVASDQPIKAMVTLTNRQVGTLGIAGGLAGGQYQGIDGAAAANSVNFPIAKSDYNSKSSTFYVQNAGSVAVTVHSKYVCGANTYEKDTTGTIAPGQMVVLSPADASVPAGSLCAATMSATQPIAGVSVEAWTTESIATLVQASRGFTSADYATTIYAPLYKKNFPKVTGGVQGRSTGAQVMNVTTGSINVTATYYYSGGTCPTGSSTETKTGIAAGASWTFLKPASMPDGCLASAMFVGTGNIVGLVSESFLDPVAAKGTQAATTYNMLPLQSATTKISVPLYKEAYGAKTTGLQVQNIGATEATIYMVFKSGTTSWTTTDQTIPAGASKTYLNVSNATNYPPATFWVGGTAMPANTNASVTVYSKTSADNILAIVAETSWPVCFGPGATPCYDKLNYEGFNLVP